MAVGLASTHNLYFIVFAFFSIISIMNISFFIVSFVINGHPSSASFLHSIHHTDRWGLFITYTPQHIDFVHTVPCLLLLISCCQRSCVNSLCFLCGVSSFVLWWSTSQTIGQHISVSTGQPCTCSLTEMHGENVLWLRCYVFRPQILFGLDEKWKHWSVCAVKIREGSLWLCSRDVLYAQCVQMQWHLVND